MGMEFHNATPPVFLQFQANFMMSSSYKFPSWQPCVAKNYLLSHEIHVHVCL